MCPRSAFQLGFAGNIDPTWYVLISSICEIVHLQVELDGTVDMIVQLLFVNGYKSEIVKGLKALHTLRRWFVLCLIVHQPASDIRVEALRHLIEQILSSD